VEIRASLQRTGRSPCGRVNQDKNSMFLLFSLLFLISFIKLLLSFKLTGLKSDHIVDYILIIYFRISESTVFLDYFFLLDCV